MAVLISAEPEKGVKRLNELLADGFTHECICHLPAGLALVIVSRQEQAEDKV